MEQDNIATETMMAQIEMLARENSKTAIKHMECMSDQLNIPFELLAKTTIFHLEDDLISHKKVDLNIIKSVVYHTRSNR